MDLNLYSKILKHLEDLRKNPPKGPTTTGYQPTVADIKRNLNLTETKDVLDILSQKGYLTNPNQGDHYNLTPKLDSLNLENLIIELLNEADSNEIKTTDDGWCELLGIEDYLEIQKALEALKNKKLINWYKGGMGNPNIVTLIP